MKNIKHFLFLACMFISCIMFCDEDDLLLEDREVVNLLALNDVQENDREISMLIFMLGVMENQPILCTKHVWLNFARFVQVAIGYKECDNEVQKFVDNAHRCISSVIWPKMLGYLQNNYKMSKEQLFEHCKKVLTEAIDEYWKKNSISYKKPDISEYQSFDYGIIFSHAFAIMKAYQYECKQLYQKGDQDFLLFIPHNKIVRHGLSQVFDIDAAPSYDYSAVVYGTKIQLLVPSQIESGKSFLNDVLREKSYAGNKKIKEISALPRLNILLLSHGVYKPDAPQDSYINEMPPRVFNECLTILQRYYNMQSLTIISCYAGGTMHKVLEDMQKKHSVDISYPILLGAALNTTFIINSKLTYALSVKSPGDIERSFKDINGTHFYVPVQRFLNKQTGEICGLLEYFFSCVQDKDWQSAIYSLLNTYSDITHNQFIMKKPLIDRWFNPVRNSKDMIEIGYVKAQAGSIHIPKDVNIILLKAPYYPYELICFYNASIYFAQFSSPEKIAYYYIKNLQIEDWNDGVDRFQYMYNWILQDLNKSNLIYNARIFIENFAGPTGSNDNSDSISLYIEVKPAMQGTSMLSKPDHYNYIVLKNNIVIKSSFKESENIDFQAKIKEVKEQALLQNQAYWGDQATDKPMFAQGVQRDIDDKESDKELRKQKQVLYALHVAFLAYEKSRSE